MSWWCTDASPTSCCRWIQRIGWRRSRICRPPMAWPSCSDCPAAAAQRAADRLRDSVGSRRQDLNAAIGPDPPPDLVVNAAKNPGRPGIGTQLNQIGATGPDHQAISDREALLSLEQAVMETLTTPVAHLQPTAAQRLQQHLARTDTDGDRGLHRRDGPAHCGSQRWPIHGDTGPRAPENSRARGHTDQKRQGHQRPQPDPVGRLNGQGGLAKRLPMAVATLTRRLGRKSAGDPVGGNNTRRGRLGDSGGSRGGRRPGGRGLARRSRRRQRLLALAQGLDLNVNGEFEEAGDTPGMGDHEHQLRQPGQLPLLEGLKLFDSHVQAPGKFPKRTPPALATLPQGLSKGLHADLKG